MLEKYHYFLVKIVRACYLRLKTNKNMKQVEVISKSTTMSLGNIFKIELTSVCLYDGAAALRISSIWQEGL